MRPRGLIAFATLGVLGCSLTTSLDELRSADASIPVTDAGPDRIDASEASIPDGPCVPESDPNFCKRLGKTCESVTDLDNCKVSRTVASCGVCGSTDACIANVCGPPACGGSYSGTGVTIPSLNINGAQAALFGVSGTGASVLFMRGASGCLFSNTPVNIGDAANVNLPTPPSYVVSPIGSLPALAGMTRQQQTMTLSSDGLTIVGVGTSNQTFLESKRSAVGATDFSVAAAGAYNTINASLPAGGSFVLPALSPDSLAFYYTINGAQNVNLNGVYEATRLQTNVPFNAGVKMPAIVQNYDGVTGVSSDRMTLFVSKNFAITMLSRSSLSQPYAVSSIVPPDQASRVQPIASCGYLFGTCLPGGCAGETICIWAKH